MNIEEVQRRLWEQSRVHKQHRESGTLLFPTNPYDGRIGNLMDLMHNPTWIAAACDRVLKRSRMRVESSGKPDAWKLARPVWGWGRGETPRPTPRDGLAIWYKRLEEGTFSLPMVEDDVTGVTLSGADLTLLLQGLDLKIARRRKRFRCPA